MVKLSDKCSRLINRNALAAQGGSDYTEFFWAFYLALRLMHDNDVAFGQLKSVTSEELTTILEKVYNSENRFWMTRAAVDAVEKPEIHASRYLKSVRRNRVLNEIISNNRKHARDGKSVATRRFSLTKFD